MTSWNVTVLLLIKQCDLASSHAYVCANNNANVLQMTKHIHNFVRSTLSLSDWYQIYDIVIIKRQPTDKRFFFQRLITFLFIEEDQLDLSFENFINKTKQQNKNAGPTMPSISFAIYKCRDKVLHNCVNNNNKKR